MAIIAAVVLAVRRSSIISQAVRRPGSRNLIALAITLALRRLAFCTIHTSHCHRLIALIAPVLLHRRSRIWVAVTLRCVSLFAASGPSSPSSVRLLRGRFASRTAAMPSHAPCSSFVRPPTLPRGAPLLLASMRRVVPESTIRGRQMSRAGRGSRQQGSCIRSMLGGHLHSQDAVLACARRGSISGDLAVVARTSLALGYRIIPCSGIFYDVAFFYLTCRLPVTGTAKLHPTFARVR